jgi:ubiquinone biosynthesis protein
MLQKTMVVVEGVARKLDPRLDMWKTSEPVVRSWIERNLGPVGRVEEAGRGALSLASTIGRIPSLAARAERALAGMEEGMRHGFPLAPDTLAGIGRAEARRARWGNLALWVIAVALVVLAWRLFS